MVTFFVLFWIITLFTLAFLIMQLKKVKENERIKKELERIESLKGLNKLKYKVKRTFKKQEKLEIKPVKFNEKQIKNYIIASIVASVISFAGIGITGTNTTSNLNKYNNASTINENKTTIIDSEENANVENNSNETTENNVSKLNITYTKQMLENNKESALKSIPDYSGNPYVVINNNTPFFDYNEITNKSYENYASLDTLGRCGVASACIGKDIMPTEARGDIGNVKPTGWHSVKYQGIDGNYLYNRCHLIGFQLAGENANEKNLITGTRYLNVDGMLPFENMVADYVKETNNHVLYRVTPVFEENNLLAFGVLMEAYSVEDNGDGIQYCVYCYNVQPGIEINYVTGESSGPAYTGNSVYRTSSGKKYHFDPDCGGK